MNYHHRVAKEHARHAIKHLARFCRGVCRYTECNPSILDICIKHLVEARCCMAVGDSCDYSEGRRTATEAMQAMELVQKRHAPQ